MSASNVLILDNGGSTAKVGWATESTPKTIPNYAVRPKRENKVYIADQLEEVTDHSGLFFRRPMEKGVVLNWELETQIWSRLVNLTECSPRDSALMLLEAPFTLQQSLCHEVVFEKLNFSSLHRSMSPTHAALGVGVENNDATKLPCSLVIDSGYTHTHIVPVYRNTPMRDHVTRLNIGGRLLTNLLKEMLSVRQVDLDGEVTIVNDIKEKLCFVSTDFQSDLDMAKVKKAGNNWLRREYILPNYTTTYAGAVRDPSLSVACVPPSSEDQHVLLTNERFSVPEVLFRPVDVGLDQMGVSELVMHTIDSLPEPLRGPMLSNIICTGGYFNMPQATARLQKEVRALAPTDIPVRVLAATDSTVTNWRGAKEFVRACGNSFTTNYCITKAEWDEHGDNIVKRKFLI